MEIIFGKMMVNNGYTIWVEKIIDEERTTGINVAMPQTYHLGMSLTTYLSFYNDVRYGLSLGLPHYGIRVCLKIRNSSTLAIFLGKMLKNQRIPTHISNKIGMKPSSL